MPNLATLKYLHIYVCELARRDGGESSVQNPVWQTGGPSHLVHQKWKERHHKSLWRFKWLCPSKPRGLSARPGGGPGSVGVRALSLTLLALRERDAATAARRRLGWHGSAKFLCKCLLYCLIRINTFLHTTHSTGQAVKFLGSPQDTIYICKRGNEGEFRVHSGSVSLKLRV